MIRRITHRPFKIVLALALAVAISGCSSSTPSGSTQAASSMTSSATDVTGEASSVSPSSPGTVATTPVSPASTSSSSSDDTSAITAAFTTFFDGLDPDTDAKIAVLEHGDVLGSMIVDAAKNVQFQQLTTVVNSVSVLSDADCAVAGEVAPCALVEHDLFVGGLPAMVGLKSHAVQVGGTWMVSASSWCAVVTIGGETCPELPAA